MLIVITSRCWTAPGETFATYFVIIPASNGSVGKCVFQDGVEFRRCPHVSREAVTHNQIGEAVPALMQDTRPATLTSGLTPPITSRLSVILAAIGGVQPSLLVHLDQKPLKLLRVGSRRGWSAIFLDIAETAEQA